MCGPSPIAPTTHHPAVAPRLTFVCVLVRRVADFKFDDSSKAELHGLAGTSFIDKCDGRKVKQQPDGALNPKAEAAKSGADAGKAGFVDRIYQSSPKVTQIKLEGGAALYDVTQSDSWMDTTV